jgi:hypothetical protein
MGRWLAGIAFERLGWGGPALVIALAASIVTVVWGRARS